MEDPAAEGLDDLVSPRWRPRAVTAHGQCGTVLRRFERWQIARSLFYTLRRVAHREWIHSRWAVSV